MENEMTEQQKQEQQELYTALGIRARLGKSHGWGYAIKWFADWEKSQAEKKAK